MQVDISGNHGCVMGTNFAHLFEAEGVQISRRTTSISAQVPGLDWYFWRLPATAFFQKALKKNNDHYLHGDIDIDLQKYRYNMYTYIYIYIYVYLKIMMYHVIVDLGTSYQYFAGKDCQIYFSWVWWCLSLVDLPSPQTNSTNTLKSVMVRRQSFRYFGVRRPMLQVRLLVQLAPGTTASPLLSMRPWGCSFHCLGGVFFFCGVSANF